MIYVSAYSEEGRFHCTLTNKRCSVDCVGGSFPSTFARAVVKLAIRQLYEMFVKRKPDGAADNLLEDTASDTKEVRQR